MNEISMTCKDKKRYLDIRTPKTEQQAQLGLNGLDFVDVDSKDRRILKVYLIRKANENLIDLFDEDDAKNHILIKGGRRFTNLEVTSITLNSFENEPMVDDYFSLTVNKVGDFSDYTLHFVELDEFGRPLEDKPLSLFDPHYASVKFNFLRECPSDFDCKPRTICPPKTYREPDIDYMAKDYATFRQLILDRWAQIMPGWKEQHVPDFGIAMAEVMAYVGDYLSYYQDAVATEAYLDTARQRVSVRRHARLIDYQVHEGCNARAWLTIKVLSENPVELNSNDIFFVTDFKNAPLKKNILFSEDLKNIPQSQYIVFEPLMRESEPGQSNIYLNPFHNSIEFYTWGDINCCLPRGATSATLKDEWIQPPVPTSVEQISQMKQMDQSEEQSPLNRERRLNLKIGDFLIFEEVIGPKTGAPENADPNHRHVVRITNLENGVDELYDTPIVEIEWAEEDALPFPLCVSTVGPPPTCLYLENVSVARGNVLLVDHGRRVDNESLGEVPVKSINIHCVREQRPSDTAFFPEQFRPILNESSLTFSEPIEGKGSAASLWKQAPRKAMPQVILKSLNFVPIGEIEEQWQPQNHLLNSLEDDRHFVIETDNQRQAHLRFGDGELGRLPEAKMQFTANYRIGNGIVGNVGSESISYIVYRNHVSTNDKLQPRNPFPAKGGTEPESLSEVKIYAPQAFRKILERAVTPEDYATLAERHPAVQRASATFRWTGSWYEVMVAIDPYGKIQSIDKLLDEVEKYLFKYRRIGHDLTVVQAKYVPLDIVMVVCVKPGYLNGHVKPALLDVFSNSIMPDGRNGFFHPDRLTFGQSIRLSSLIATAKAVPGVENLVVTKFEQIFEGPNQELENGILPISPLEIARLDNDPSFPENGKLELKMRGER